MSSTLQELKSLNFPQGNAKKQREKSNESYKRTKKIKSGVPANSPDNKYEHNLFTDHSFASGV